MGCLMLIIMMLGFGIVLWGFSVSTSLGFVLTALLIGGGIFYYQVHDTKRKNVMDYYMSKFQKSIENIEGIKATQKFVSADGKSLIGLDENSKKICIIENEKGISEQVPTFNDFKIFSYRDLLESEIIEDGISITSTSRTSQIGGALLGGVLAGGVGAIIGGLSGEKKSSDAIKRIDLKIVVNNTSKPIYIINFMTNYNYMTDLENKDGYSKDSDKYQNGIKNARYWHSLISVLIRQADQIDDENKGVNKKLNDTPLSIADELKKLVELKDLGILTEEEFNNQKQKLLS